MQLNDLPNSHVHEKESLRGSELIYQRSCNSIVVCNFQSVDQDVVQEENITIVEQALDAAAGMTKCLWY